MVSAELRGVAVAGGTGRLSTEDACALPPGARRPRRDHELGCGGTAQVKVTFQSEGGSFSNIPLKPAMSF
jgi:hypothetical protein